MTDKEITKALECCHITCGCSECAYVACPEDCVETMKLDALDLINRQQAEIERLSNSAKQWEDTAKDLFISKEKQQAEIERLTINMNAFGLGMKQEKERADTIKSEAIKEFADKMKGVIPEIDDTYIERIVEDYIDNLLKEMVGEDK